MRCKHIWHDNSKGTWVCGICKRQESIDSMLEERYNMNAELDYLRGSLRIVADYIKGRSDIPDNVVKVVNDALK